MGLYGPGWVITIGLGGNMGLRVGPFSHTSNGTVFLWNLKSEKAKVQARVAHRRRRLISLCVSIHFHFQIQFLSPANLLLRLPPSLSLLATSRSNSSSWLFLSLSSFVATLLQSSPHRVKSTDHWLGAELGTWRIWFHWLTGCKERAPPSEITEKRPRCPLFGTLCLLSPSSVVRYGRLLLLLHVLLPFPFNETYCYCCCCLDLCGKKGFWNVKFVCSMFL